MRVIAKVRLVRGNVAFFDSKTKIHLTIGNPIGQIYENMDIQNIKKAVKNGTLLLVSGSLVLPVKETAHKIEQNPKVPIVTIDVKEVEKEIAPEAVVPTTEQSVVLHTEEIVKEAVVIPNAEEKLAEVKPDVVEGTEDEQDQEEKRGRKKGKKDKE